MSPHRDRAELPTTRGIWSTELTTDKQGRRRHVGHRIETWARQTKHTDGITWFLSKLAAEARENPESELMWSIPTARSDRTYNWGDYAIAPDAIGQMTAEGPSDTVLLRVRATRPSPPGSYGSPETPTRCTTTPTSRGEDQPPFPVTLFVVDTEEVEDTYASTAAVMTLMDRARPGVLHSRAVTQGDTGGVLASLVGAVLPPAGAVRAEAPTSGTVSTTGCVPVL